MRSPIRPADPSASLNADRRARWLDRLSDGHPIDVLVIGGGITGVGVALDAASRGLRTVLVEREDLAFGTSRWSSKLVHGGLRYLASGHVGIAWESAVERDVLARTIAPHLIRPIAQVVPLYGGADDPPAALALAGLTAADSMRVAAGTPSNLLPRARRVDAAEALRLAPALDAERLQGALVSWDCQLVDDARLVVGVARTAAAFGAMILTRCEVLSWEPGEARVLDRLSGETLSLKATHIVNATGAWAGELDEAVALSPSQGTHVIVRSSSLGHSTGSITVPVPGHSGRFVFALPQPDGLTFIGLTDEPLHGPVPAVPQPTPGEIDWILGVISPWLARPLTHGDVIGSFAGVRPLVSGGTDSSADLSRRHALIDHGDGRLTITGGKLTTYRRMAQEVVDAITHRPCSTTRIGLIGSGATRSGHPGHDRLERRYGNEASAVGELGALPLVDGLPALLGEAAFAVSHEGALSAEDVLERRLRLSFHPGWEEALPLVSGMLGALPV